MIEEPENWCCVRISFYKPTGWDEVFWVRTTHRGKAVKRVFQHYEDLIEKEVDHMFCLNEVVVNRSEPKPDAVRGTILEL